MSDFNDSNDFNDLSADQNIQEFESSEEVKEVKLGRGVVAVILITALIILMILLITLKGCSVQKKVNSDSISTSATTVLNNEEKPSENVVENSQTSANSVPISTDATTTSAEVSEPQSTEISSSKSTSPKQTGDKGFKEVPEASLSDIVTTTGIVVSKKVYYYNNCYVYGLNLSIIIDDGTKSVMYFCPKRTYDALSSADAITVEYQIDNKGSVSVSSISK